MNRIITMFMRQFMNIGINKGIDHIYRNKNADPNSPEAKQAQKNAGAASKNAKQTIRMVRRLGRF